MEDVCKTLRPGDHPLKNHQHLSIRFNIDINLLFHLLKYLTFNKLFKHIDSTLFNRPRTSFHRDVIGQFYCDCELP